MNVQDVQKLPFELHQIFSIDTEDKFRDLALKTFNFQFENNTVYRQYVELINKRPSSIKEVEEIPFLPIEFFKTKAVKTFQGEGPLAFRSSGTTGQEYSVHEILDPTVYELSFIKAFEHFYGHLEDYLIVGLLPSYMDNDQSSLIYMVDHLMQLTKDRDSGFFLNDMERLLEVINRRKGDKKILLIGVSYALLDLAEKYGPDLNDCFVMETGGMKGRRKELTKEELHARLCKGLNVSAIHSEYGMTELLSQAYSHGNGVFQCPNWMKVIIRSHDDPFEIKTQGSGGINVIDLANVYSCSFIATQDLGKTVAGGFEVLGRFDNSDIRGCNLLIQ